MEPSGFRSPARRLSGIINGLFLAITLRRDTGFRAGPVANLLWTRLAHLRGRVARLAERLAAGKEPGVPRRRPTPDGTAWQRTPAHPPQLLLPRNGGWMLRLVPDAVATGSQLQFLLADPEMVALAEAAPQLGRLLRPLCRGLGVVMPGYLKPPPRPRAARPPAERKPRAPRPLRSTAAQVRAAWPGVRRPHHLHGLAFLGIDGAPAKPPMRIGRGRPQLE
jgi:hypothetical protein